ncbi:MAG: MotA/TolQ/ExbB proton channel family protein [Calditrichia bacterium]
MIELFSKGGLMMYPLILCSVFALAIILERFWYLRRTKILTPEIVGVLEQIQTPKDLELAKSVCRRSKGPFARIVLSGLDNRDLPPDEMRALVEDEGRQEVRNLQRGLVSMETIAAIAPLIGLLGTVIGMIKVFNVIQTLGVGQAKALSGGISEALITTATGLIIGIPTLVAFTYFSARAEALILDMEKYMLLVLNKLIRFQRGELSKIEKIDLRNDI